MTQRGSDSPAQMSLLDILDRPPIEAMYTPDQIYESHDAMLHVRLTEDARFDRKSAQIQPKDLAKNLSAFGNGPSIDGGVVAVGIEKDGTISGCNHLEQNRLSELESCGIVHYPDGRCVARRQFVKNAKGDDDFIILIRIYYVEGKLVSLTNGEAYERVGDQSKKAFRRQKARDSNR
jgi:ATP-dependent DNA helicase RecG